MPLRQFGAWRTVWERRTAHGALRVQMPRLAVTPSSHHGFGRPRLIDSNPERLAQLAMFGDLAGCGDRVLARRLEPQNDATSAEDTGRSTVRYQRRRARQMLCVLGVLPWAAYAEGKLPRTWVDDPAFLDSVERWINQTALTMATEPFQRARRAVQHITTTPSRLAEAVLCRR